MIASLVETLMTAGPGNAVAVRDAADGEAWPVEAVRDGIAVACADAVVAETAAIVLFGGDDRLRPLLSATELVAHVRADAIVPEFGDALARFSGEGRMISICGPSRTADIEKKLVIGVHGPRTVTIVVHAEASRP